MGRFAESPVPCPLCVISICPLWIMGESCFLGCTSSSITYFVCLTPRLPLQALSHEPLLCPEAVLESSQTRGQQHNGCRAAQQAARRYWEQGSCHAEGLVRTAGVVGHSSCSPLSLGTTCLLFLNKGMKSSWPQGELGPRPHPWGSGSSYKCTDGKTRFPPSEGLSFSMSTHQPSLPLHSKCFWVLRPPDPTVPSGASRLHSPATPASVAFMSLLCTTEQFAMFGTFFPWLFLSQDHHILRISVWVLSQQGLSPPPQLSDVLLAFSACDRTS